MTLVLDRSERFIKLNFEDLKHLDSLIVKCYDKWVEEAPDGWKVDGFLRDRSPIMVTSQFGQNSSITARGNESHEANAWQLERDYSKMAFLTIALATQIKYALLPRPFLPLTLPSSRCTEIKGWKTVSTNDIIRENKGGLYDSAKPELCRSVRLRDHPLLDDDRKEISIYNAAGRRIPRRCPEVDANSPPCGVLVDLTNVHALFDPHQNFDHEEPWTTSSDLEDPPPVRVDAYPLAFLGSVENIQANGIPSCFYPELTKINKSVRKRHADGSFSPEDRSLSEDEDATYANDSYPKPSLQAVKPICAQFYNYATHRMATRAGRLDSQQGTVTAAISGAFANSSKHRSTALRKQSYCEQSLPSQRFHDKISLERCPTSCRAEFVYSIDIRALKDPSGRHVFFPPFLPPSPPL
jgi:hypothetical protein